MSLREARIELARRKAKRDEILSRCHPMQRQVITAPDKYKAVLAGRRSGKTEMGAHYLAIELEKCVRDDWVLYSAVTRGIAFDLMWSKLERLNEDHQLGWSMRAHERVIENTRKGRLRLLGFDDQAQVEKSCGYRIRLFQADEPHSYASRLKYLSEQKIGPALSDRDGTLLMTGTPGIARTGFWYEASTGKLDGCRAWHWTMRQNPYLLRPAEEVIHSVLRRHNWTEETPQFRREYLAEWCDDEGQQVYAYVGDRNGVDGVEVNYDGLFTLAIDFGFSPDPCAWAVLYSPPHSRDTYVIHAETHSGLLPEQAIDVTRALYDRYRPSRLVGDAGGLGKPYVEAWNRRYGHEAGMHMHAAEKSEKRANIEITNGELRAGRLKVVEPWCPGLVDEVTNLVWADEAREKEHPGCANHILDAAFAYGFRDHRAYLQRALPPQPKTADEIAEAAKWARIEATQRAMQQAASEWDDY